MTDPRLTHLRGDGSAHMVDVTDKAVTRRTASAQAILVTRADVVAAISDGSLPKGEAIGTARIAGIMAAKQTSTLIPLCHPLPLTKLDVDITPEGHRVRIVATVTTKGVTGVEMEALTAVAVAGLAVIDMVKGLDKSVSLADVRLERKTGGKSGDWVRAE